MRPAPDWPGQDMGWTNAAKDAVGTAYSDSSEVWFTLAGGILTEIYYPTLDQGQIRDVQLLITDGRTFCHEEKDLADYTVKPIAPQTLGYTVTSEDPNKRYRIIKEIITDPHAPVVLLRVRLETAEAGS